MKFIDAVRFPFCGPNAWPNIGLLWVCFLIPIVGPIVAMGYQCGIEKMLIGTIDADAPRFDFGKFTFYLQRGVKPFVVGLIASVILIPAVLLLWLGVFVASIALWSDHPGLVVLMILAAVVVFMLLSLVIGVVFMPPILRASVEGVIGPAFDKAFWLDYLRRMGWRTLLLNLQIMLLMIPFMFVACIPFLMYAVLGVVFLMQSHARAQLYLEYLARGGVPLAIVPDPPEPGFPVVAQQSPGANAP